jgi:hypothetical protein
VQKLYIKRWCFIKKYNISEHFEKILTLLQESKVQGEDFILWQNIDGSRKTKAGKLVDISESDIAFTGIDDQFSDDEDLFFHCKESQYIFKINDFSLGDEFRCPIPREVVFVGDSFTVHGTTDHIENKIFSHDSFTDKIKHKSLSGSVSGTDKISSTMAASLKTDKISSTMSASLKTDKISTFDSVKKLNEDEIFAAQRAAPRARPKKDKKVTLKLLDSSEKVFTYSLFDLSTGGMGFNITNRDMFQKNDKLLVTAIDGKDLDKNMIGVIRNIREDGPNAFRVGVQFVDE